MEETTGVDVEEFLRGLDEPPEVLRTLDAWLADRRGFDPVDLGRGPGAMPRATAVVETAAGRVVRAVRPHVATAVVRTMFATDPVDALAQVRAPVTALVALASGELGTRGWRSCDGPPRHAPAPVVAPSGWPASPPMPTISCAIGRPRSAARSWGRPIRASAARISPAGGAANRGTWRPTDACRLLAKAPGP